MINVVAIVGRLTRDPEIKYSNDLCIASFSIACNRRIKNKDGEYETDFFEVTTFGKTGEFLEKYFKKGSKIEIRGRLQQDRWQNQDGKSRQKVIIVAEEIGFGESRAESGGGSKPSEAPKQTEKPSQSSEDFMPVGNQFETDLPFA